MDEDGVRVMRRQLADLHLQLLTLLNKVRDMEDTCVQVLGNEHRRVPFTTLPPPQTITIMDPRDGSLCIPCSAWDYTNLNGC